MRLLVMLGSLAALAAPGNTAPQMQIDGTAWAPSKCFNFDVNGHTGVAIGTSERIIVMLDAQKDYGSTFLLGNRSDDTFRTFGAGKCATATRTPGVKNGVVANISVKCGPHTGTMTMTCNAPPSAGPQHLPGDQTTMGWSWSFLWDWF